MSYLVYLSQKISPLECCRQPINTKKQLNLYQSQLSEPLKLSTYDKAKTIQKVVHVNDFYRSSEFESNFKVVEKSHYEEVVKICEQRHEMFEDKEFEASDRVIEGMVQGKKIVWRRLSEMYNRAEYSIIDSETTSHVSTKDPPCQLNFTPLKPSAFMSVLCTIKDNPKLINQIFRTSHQPINNFGIYRLILNDHGYPKEVVVDDYVPVYINTSQLVLSHPYMKQLWPIVLEKSIAKVVGSYSQLQTMPAHQILRLITPAPTVKYQLHSTDAAGTLDSHIQILKNALLNQYTICATSKTALENHRIKPNHAYTVIEVENHSNQEPLIVLLDPLFDDDGLTENESGMSLSSNLSKSPNYKQVFKLKYASFVKYFNDFCVCYFQQNFSMDFQRMQMDNRKPQYVNLQLQQDSEIVLTFSRVRRKFKQLPFINLSHVTHGIRNFTGVKGGWLKMLIAKHSTKDTQNVMEFVQTQIETEDNTLSIHFRKLRAGRYVIYLQGYSEQNDSEYYGFSGYGSKPFFISSQRQISPKLQYLLQEVMLNHCLKAQKDNKVINNYFIQKDHESWYVSNLLYKDGGFGYLVLFVGKESKYGVKIAIDLEKIREQGYKLECKKVSKVYKKIIEPGSADVMVFSINYEAKRDTHRVEFPPKSVALQIFQKIPKPNSSSSIRQG